MTNVKIQSSNEIFTLLDKGFKILIYALKPLYSWEVTILIIFISNRARITKCQKY